MQFQASENTSEVALKEPGSQLETTEFDTERLEIQ